MKGKFRELSFDPFRLLLNPIILRSLSTLFKEVFIRKSSLSHEKDDESLKDFFIRHFGPYITETLVASFILGIYGGNISKLSLKACFPYLWELEKQSGSLLRGLFFKSKQKASRDPVDVPQETALLLWNEIRNKSGGGGIISFNSGLQSLPDTLATRYKHNIQLSSEVMTLSSLENNQLEITLQRKDVNGPKNEKIVADHVISCLPSNELASILQSTCPEISALLNQIPFVDIATVNLGYSENVIPSSIRGFGYLIPPSEQEEVLGVTFDSVTFPRDSKSGVCYLTVMLGGDRDIHKNVVDVSNTSEKALLEISLRHLKQRLAISKQPTQVLIKVCKNAIPQYTLGHTQRLNTIRNLLQQKLPRLQIAGNSYEGVGINDSITSAFCAAKSVIHSFTVLRNQNLS
jgi:oxygen-dependent protoporphyrinogen oxidase